MLWEKNIIPYLKSTVEIVLIEVISMLIPVKIVKFEQALPT
jgi:hypothetical protein